MKNALNMANSTKNSDNMADFIKNSTNMADSITNSNNLADLKKYGKFYKKVLKIWPNL